MKKGRKIKRRYKMRVGDRAVITSEKGGHLFKGAEVEIVKILSPKNEKPILVKPVDGIMGGWFEAKDLKIVED